MYEDSLGQKEIIELIFLFNLNLFHSLYFWCYFIYSFLAALHCFCGEQEATLLLWCSGFSWRGVCHGAQALGARTSVAAWELSSCGTGLTCSEACGIFPAWEPMSPALADRFLPTAPPGKPQATFLTAHQQTLATNGLWPSVCVCVCVRVVFEVDWRIFTPYSM